MPPPLPSWLSSSILGRLLPRLSPTRQASLIRPIALTSTSTSTSTSSSPYLFSSASPMVQPVKYEEVAQMLRNKNGCLLDVRSDEELETHGRYPSYVHVPHTEVEAAMKLSDEEFRRRYHADKPKPSDLVVTSCMAGRRANMAADALLRLSFTNVKVYSGSFSDWMKHQGQGGADGK